LITITTLKQKTKNAIDKSTVERAGKKQQRQ
jgi:hypothetical protein